MAIMMQFVPWVTRAQRGRGGVGEGGPLPLPLRSHPRAVRGMEARPTRRRLAFET